MTLGGGGGGQPPLQSKVAGEAAEERLLLRDTSRLDEIPRKLCNEGLDRLMNRLSDLGRVQTGNLVSPFYM